MSNTLQMIYASDPVNDLIIHTLGLAQPVQKIASGFKANF